MKYWTISSQVLIEEAEKLGLNYEIINKNKNLFRVFNDSKEVMFKGTDCGVNSSLGLKIANDKELTYNMLSRTGLPLATTVYLSKEDWNGKFDDSGFTYPLVVKPVDGAHGDGVVMNLVNNDEVVDALAEAFKFYTRMIVQNQVEGDEYRILVFQGEVIFAARRAYPYVIGDGKLTIGELIENENKSNPLRGEGYEKPLAYIKVDDETIKQIEGLGYTINSILLEGEKVIVRRNSNVGTGGIYEDIIDKISKEFMNMAIKAGEVSQLNFVGVDLLTDDISSYSSKSTILEIGATCGIGGHRELTSVNTGMIILKKLFTL